ncbi:hypothetical protein PGTUg99_000103 [Puccinia graminis f. sp. tritici]|uniref:Uncharacterized protein n=1 Tax=Puccinia graminis f. sp. tritici TaxID=56615 RepID=A0A5B0S9D4_PUCGR|nr:hypothetical protein PGTUg99_000103 [Puccinia graminis f. sp. tritici]
MTLPVGEIHSPIKDPLTSHSDSESSTPPLWYTRMSKKAVVIHLSIEQVAVGDMLGPTTHEQNKGLKKSQDFQAIVNGGKEESDFD